MTPASYVLFPLGAKRFAVHAEAVAELARPGRLHTFPHTTPLLTGVLLRRGRIVPVCDIGQVLVGSDAPARRFYLIVQRPAESGGEWTAIPVSGECELVRGEETPGNSASPAWVTGVLSLPETVEVLDVDQLVLMGMNHSGAPQGASVPQSGTAPATPAWPGGRGNPEAPA
jgi:chemotaxis signal transduction protein